MRDAKKLSTPLFFVEHGEIQEAENIFQPRIMNDAVEVLQRLFLYFETNFQRMVAVDIEDSRILQSMPSENYIPGKAYQLIGRPKTETYHVWEPWNIKYAINPLQADNHIWAKSVFINKELGNCELARGISFLREYEKAKKDPKFENKDKLISYMQLADHPGVKNVIYPKSITYDVLEKGEEKGQQVAHNVPFLVSHRHLNSPKWLLIDTRKLMLDPDQPNDSFHRFKFREKRHKSPNIGYQRKLWDSVVYEVVGIVHWKKNHYTFLDANGWFNDNKKLKTKGCDLTYSVMLIMQRKTPVSDTSTVSAEAQGGNGKTNDES
jgi:hypothetical protein